MSVRTELESMEMAILRLQKDIAYLRERMLGPRWVFARANLAQADSRLLAAKGHIRESHTHVPELLDTDD
jgi:hypothetical protein